MIINLPTSENMTTLSLRLHFGAWAALTTMEFQFDQEFVESEQNDWAAERAEYYEYCQPELQATCTIIQQSNELALKARLCQVSPYLLLLNSDANLSTKGEDIDFTTFRTLDAVDLPAAVNSFCDDKLTDKFLQTYNQIRAYRNQITHIIKLLQSRKRFRPGEPYFDMEPFEVLRDIIRSKEFHDVGGPPQMVKIYRHGNTQPFAVKWDMPHDRKVSVLGRPLFPGEVTRLPIIDPDDINFLPEKTIEKRKRRSAKAQIAAFDPEVDGDKPGSKD